MTRCFDIKSYFIRVIIVIATLTTPLTANTCSKHDQLIPRQEFFGGNIERKWMSPLALISPDGTKVSYIAPYKGVLNIWVAQVNDLGNRKPLTKDKAKGIISHHWTHTNNDIIYEQDNDGDENSRLYVVNLSSQKTKLLLNIDKSVQARLEKFSAKFPDEVLVGLNERDPRNHDLYRVNIHTGKKKLVYQNNGFLRILCDSNLAPQFALKPLQDGEAQILYYSNGNFLPYKKISYPDYSRNHYAYSKHDFIADASEEYVYLLDSQKSNFQRLYRTSLKDMQLHGEKAPAKLIFKDPKADIKEVVFSNKSGNVLAVASEYFKQKWHIVDQKSAKNFKYLTSKLGENISVASQSIDDNHWIVAADSDVKPATYYYYNTQTNDLKQVLSVCPELEKYENVFGKTHAVEIAVRDGLKIPSYVTMPKKFYKGGKSTKPIPFVVLVHGGPKMKDHWEFNNDVQFLVNRGYGVLQMNYTISSGIGKKLFNAGEYGGRSLEDIVDGAKWLVKNKFTTKDKTAIMGGSYGGYATLAALTFHPDIFACGIDIVGRSNLEDYIKNIPTYWYNYVSSSAMMLKADPRTEEGKKYLRSKSPLFFADQIKVPLLILHGKNDPRIKQKESDLIVAEMNKKGVPVGYGIFSNEGHGFVRPENRIASRALIEAFLAKYLGGKYQPIGDEIKKSSLIIKQDPLNVLN